MINVPIQSEPNQSLQVVLNQQNCFIDLRTMGGNLYFSMSVNDVQIVTNRICLNGVSLVPTKYLGFTGDLIFVDAYGKNDPSYEGLGSQFYLVYLD